MFKNFFARKIDPSKPLYEAIVAAARQPKFYTTLGVADTIEGRFDLLILHVYLVVARLKTQAPDLCQKLMNAFCEDMDGNLREMGVGDLGVGKKVRRMAEALTGRIYAYDHAQSQTELEAALTRNVYHGVENKNVEALAAWVLKSREILGALTLEDLNAGLVKFA